MRFLLLFLLLATPCFADVKEDRIKVLTQEGERLVQEVNQMNQAIQEKTQRVIEIRGAIKELSIQPENIKK